MGSWKKHYSTEHLDAVDIPEGKKVTVKIKRIGDVKVTGEKGDEKKMLITFEPSAAFAAVCPKRTWAAPKTMGHCLQVMFGGPDGKDDNEELWLEKRITLHVEQVEAFGEFVDAVRIYGSPDITTPKQIRVKQGRTKKLITLNPVVISAAPTAAKPEATAPSDQPPADL